MHDKFYHWASLTFLENVLQYIEQDDFISLGACGIKNTSVEIL